MHSLIRLLTIMLASLLLVSTASAAFTISFTNSSKYNDDEVYLWFTADTATNQRYGLKKKGESQNLRLGTPYKFSDLKDGLEVSYYSGGRIYISYGAPLPEVPLDPNGKPIRNPGVHGDDDGKGDDGYNIRYDFVELTYTPHPADVADLTSMDQFAIPIQLQLRKGGKNLTGPSTSAGWRGNKDQDVVKALAKQANPAGDNVYYDKQGLFIRIKGATTFTKLYHNDPQNSRSMAKYLEQIYKDQQEKGRSLTIKGHDYEKDYEYEAKLVIPSELPTFLVTPASETSPQPPLYSYSLTKTGGDASNPQTILVPAAYRKDPDVPNPLTTYFYDAILESNPWFSVDGGPIGPTGDIPRAVTRDLFAALNLGYVNSEHKVAASETIHPETVGKSIHELTTKEMRGLNVAFSEVNSFYNIYADTIRHLSDSYGYAYSDWSEHLTKVVVLMNAEHKEDGQTVKADELNIEFLGGPITKGAQTTPPASDNHQTPSRKPGYLESVDDFLTN